MSKINWDLWNCMCEIRLQGYRDYLEETANKVDADYSVFEWLCPLEKEGVLFLERFYPRQRLHDFLRNILIDSIDIDIKISLEEINEAIKNIKENY